MVNKTLKKKKTIVTARWGTSCA